MDVRNIDISLDPRYGWGCSYDTQGYVGKHNGMEFVGQNGRYSY
jgi:hypothetical protein